MNRRTFLSALASIAVAPFVPTPAPAPVGLQFKRDAFVFVMADIQLPTRYDVLWGMSVIRPTYVGRISSEEDH